MIAMFIARSRREWPNQTRAQSFQLILRLTRRRSQLDEAAIWIASDDRIGQTLRGPLFRAQLAVNWTFRWSADHRIDLERTRMLRVLNLRKRSRRERRR